MPDLRHAVANAMTLGANAMTLGANAMTLGAATSR
jgi:hypothetical protein